MMPNATFADLDIRRAAFAQGGILFDAACLPQAHPALLEAAAWPGASALEGRGGRGAAWWVCGSFGQGLLRHYRRGGLLGRWLGDRYLFLGSERARSVREFLMMAELLRRGLPVPRPLLAGWHRSGLVYRADLLTLRIPDARTLAQCMHRPETPWTGIGATLARFHREGAFHADLNAHNVLLDAEGRVWLIDFDRGRFRVPSQDWQHANLRRLKRSLDKLGGVSAADWSALLAGYAGAQAEEAPEEGW